MRVKVDATRCMGHGVCESLRPDLFEVDDDGLSRWKPDSDVDAAEESDLQLAVSQCPMQALILER